MLIPAREYLTRDENVTCRTYLGATSTAFSSPKIVGTYTGAVWTSRAIHLPKYGSPADESCCPLDLGGLRRIER